MKRLVNPQIAGMGAQLSLDFDSPREHFIGIGAAGYKALLSFYHRGQRGFYTLIGTSCPPNLPEGILYIELNAESGFNRGIASGLQGSLLGAANPMLRRLDSIFYSEQKYTLLLAAGGMNSSIIATYLAKSLHRRGSTVNAILQNPFEFEGPRKKAIAARTYSAIASICKTSVLTLDYLIREHAQQPVSRAMAIADQLFYRSYLESRLKQAA